MGLVNLRGIFLLLLSQSFKNVETFLSLVPYKIKLGWTSFAGHSLLTAVKSKGKRGVNTGVAIHI